MTLEQSNERKARRFWSCLIIGLLGSQISIGVVAIVLANSDPSVGALPNYHQRALDWDNSIELQRRSDQLGWRVDLFVAKDLDADQLRTLTVTVTDSTSRAVEHAIGTLKLFHFSRVSESQEFSLDELTSGIYRVRVPMRRPGLWRLEIHVNSDDGSRFVDARTYELDQPIRTTRGIQP